VEGTGEGIVHVIVLSWEWSSLGFQIAEGPLREKRATQMVRKSAALVFLATLLWGCTAAPPTPEQLESASHGDKPSGYKAKIRESFSFILLDPDSASYEFRSPEKGWGADGGSNVFGWVVWTQVNSKNRFGAYTGPIEYKVLLANDEVVGIYEPAGTDEGGDPVYERLF